MSYDLELYFEPAVRRDRLLEHFAARRRFSIKNDDVVYENRDTGVYFFMRLRSARKLFRSRIVCAEFEINYYRPSYFGIEAEMVLSDFVAVFQPRIEDHQIQGMGEGPYSREGFLNGWNFGNVFAARNALSPGHNVATMPPDELRATWEWNYHRAERQRRNPGLFVPGILFFRIEGRPCRAVTWGEGMPILLPKVDHVFVGRVVSNEVRFGLAPWSAVVEVVRRAGLDATSDPLKLDYRVTPSPIADWAANIPLIDVDALEKLSADKILDDELIAAAWEFETNVISDHSDEHGLG
jgi:hypothetical protein